MISRLSLRDLLWVATVPLSLIWAMATHLRRRYYPQQRRLPVLFPIVCVGNLQSGGTGKTPVVLAIATRYRDRSPVIFSRGYRGRKSAAGARVQDAVTDGPAEFGDEPWLLHRRKVCPVYVGRNRGHSMQRAASDGVVKLGIWDDGFQRLSSKPTVSLVLIDTSQPVEESFTLPHGEFREPLSALHGASAVLLACNSENTSAAQRWEDTLKEAFPQLPVFRFSRAVEGIWLGENAPENLPRDTPLIAFSGTARPESFFQLAREQVAVPATLGFPDHHVYKPGDFKALRDLRALHAAAGFLTTEKDAAKVAPVLEAAGEPLYVLRIRCELPAQFWYFLDSQLESK